MIIFSHLAVKELQNNNLTSIKSRCCQNCNYEQTGVPSPACYEWKREIQQTCTSSWFEFSACPFFLFKCETGQSGSAEAKMQQFQLSYEPGANYPGLLLLWQRMKRIELQTFPAFQLSCSGSQDLGTDPRLQLRSGVCAIIRRHWASDFLSQFVQRTLLR